MATRPQLAAVAKFMKRFRAGYVPLFGGISPDSRDAKALRRAGIESVTAVIEPPKPIFAAQYGATAANMLPGQVTHLKFYAGSTLIATRKYPKRFGPRR